MELKLLYAKDAIFRLIRDYCTSIYNSDNKKYYFYDYCESTLERAFNALEIPDDDIEEFDFYKLWEENNKKFWSALGNTDEMPKTWTAEWMYKAFGTKHSSEEDLEV